jgi:putative ABC transport system substrate-binding protein
MTLINNVLGQKRLEMLRDLSPKTSTVAMLVNPVSPDTISEIRSVQTGALALGIKLAMFNASTPNESEAAFNGIAEQRPDALLIGGDPFFLVKVRRLSRVRGDFRFRLSIHFVSLWWPAA